MQHVLAARHCAYIAEELVKPDTAETQQLVRPDAAESQYRAGQHTQRSRVGQAGVVDSRWADYLWLSELY